MPFVLPTDIKKFQSETKLYKGSGLGNKTKTSRHVYFEGESIMDLVTTGIDFIKNNPEVISKTISSASGVSKGISKAIESSNKLKQIRELKNISVENNPKPLSESSMNKIANLVKKGAGFKQF